MIQIRNSVFETNSSSTHSLNICTKQTWLDWKEGKLLYCPYSNRFIDNYLLSEDKKMARLKEYYETKVKKEFYKEFQDLSKTEIQRLMMSAVSEGYIFEPSNEVEDDDSNHCDFYTYDGYWKYYDDHLESYVVDYETESGDEIVIFGKYGYDG